MGQLTNISSESWLEVDLSRLAANYRVIAGRARRSGAVVCAVVKADAYGLGATQVVNTLREQGASMFAVYSAQQADEIVEATGDAGILLLSPVRKVDHHPSIGKLLEQDRLHLSVHDLDQLQLIRDWPKQPRLHLHLDTGMTRSGIAERDAEKLASLINENKQLRISGVYTHFATADDAADRFMHDQTDAFDRLLERLPLPDDVVVHIANTDASLRSVDHHRHMVRAGLGLYGFSYHEMSAGSDSKLQPVVRWCSRLNQVGRYKEGATVGYARTHRLTRDSLLGVIPVGYADGYNFALGNKGVVVLPRLSMPRAFAAAPVLGRISMDQIVVDLTELAERTESAEAIASGELVELYSNNPASPASVANLASLARTHCYDMLTRVGGYVQRVYLP